MRMMSRRACGPLARHALLLATGAALSLHAASLAQVTPLQTDPKPPVPAVPPPPPEPRPERQAAPIVDGPSYPITSFNLAYANEHPDRPPLDAFAGLPVELGLLDGVLVAPRDGVTPVRTTIGELAAPAADARPFAVSGINAVGAAIVAELNRRGFIGVLVAPDAAQIDFATLRDLRPAPGPLTLSIWTRTVRQVRSIGDGERWALPTARGTAPSQENRIDNPRHARIRQNSPLQPAATGSDLPGDMLRKDTLDDYLYRLNRHPARRVDAAVAAGQEPGEVVLDYIVTENRPWTAYVQVSNTGTRQTSEWRQRFGFIHNQLTNHDDILSIDYITASFDDANALSISYDRPLGRSDRWRFRLFGSYSDFTASDVGFADERFSGENWGVGGELVWNAWQKRMAFVDLFAGLRWSRVEVVNDIVEVRGDEDFFIPYLGARFERNTIKASTNAEARVEFGLDGEEEEVVRLGRINPDEEWTVLKWNAAHSFYLEPLLLGDAWEDPATPDRRTTLAHEIALSFRGQHAMGNRLIPQEQDVVGGLYSVRGFEESETAGDSVFIASAEYRFHLPRIWAIEPDPSRTPLFGKPFRRSPQQRYGFPDWDLIFKGFIDIGVANVTDKLAFEDDETLVGIGPGVEFVFRRNVNLRLDWGFALTDGPVTKAGDNRVSFVATFIY